MHRLTNTDCFLGERGRRNPNIPPFLQLPASLGESGLQGEGYLYSVDAWAEGDRGSQMTVLQSGRKECVEKDVVERTDGLICLWLVYTIRRHDSVVWLGSTTPG